MAHPKVKRIPPRGDGAIEPPEPRKRGRARLASEPTSRHLRLIDRWEPGFLRLGGGERRRALSYVVDGLGIYYDATAPSELETLLEEGGWETPELLARAEAGMSALRGRKLSLDNDPRRRSLAGLLRTAAASARSRAPSQSSDERPVVVVVDQPREDDRIGLGLAGPDRFRAMLDAAMRENEDAHIVVLPDPSAPLPQGSGYLEDLATQAGATFIREPIEAWSAVESCEAVYVVTAHLGFEGAMAGKRVVCFGTPFYAGWGFTDDRLRCSRRTRARSVAEVFAAAYLVYSRYFGPYDDKACSFEDAFEVLDLVSTRERENASDTLCVGFASWKKRWAEAVLGAPGHRPVVTQRPELGPDDLLGVERVVAWASRTAPSLEGSCRAANVPLVRMEDGFLRSVGLGVGLRPGASYVLDAAGMYYDATAPSDLETILSETVFDERLLARASALRESIVKSGVSKYNVGSAPLPPMPKGRPLVLVAGQVEDDASIKLGLAPNGGNAGLLRRVRESDPNALIAYKPHPDVEAGLRPGHISPTELARLADLVLTEVAAPDAIEAADRVEVATSLLGFEALLRGKPVVTHGLPFYAGWGLTISPPAERRTRRLTLDELVAGALILYPRYFDPRSSLPCTPEVVVSRLAEGDPAVMRRTRSSEALFKETWSLAWRRFLRARG